MGGRRLAVAVLGAVTSVAVTSVAVLSPAAWASANANPPGPPNYQAQACPAGSTPSAGFTDISGDGFAGEINCIAAYGITTGIGNHQYDPSGLVLRQQMAVFVDNLLATTRVGAPAGQAPCQFTDISRIATSEQNAICALAGAGVVHGTSATTYDPGGYVTRAQMATYLVNALAYAHLTITAPAGAVYFTDVPAAAATDINKIASVGITQGCRAQTYCPSLPLPRDEMAGFLARTLELAIEQGVATSRYSAVGSYSVTPTADAATPTGSIVSYQVSGLPAGQPFGLWLFACPNVSTAGGSPTFTPTGSSSTGYTADQGAVSGVFSDVGGTQQNSSRVAGTAGSSGSFAFSVTDAAAECVRPVLFSNSDQDGVLNVSSTGAPLEPVGVAGALTFYAPPPTGPLAAGSVTAASDTTFTQGGETYPYSAADTLQLASGGTCQATSLATFRADLTAGDSVTGSYSPSGSSYCLDDVAPLPPTTVDATAHPTGGVLVTWNDSATPSVASYVVYRATATPPSGSTGYTCPSAGPAAGTSPQAAPGSPWTQVGTATDGSPGAQGNESYQLVDTTASPGGAPANQYCYAVSSVDARGQVGTAQPATQDATGGTTAGAAPAQPAPASVTQLSENHFALVYNEALNTATCDAGDFVASYTTPADPTNHPVGLLSAFCDNNGPGGAGEAQLTFAGNVPAGATLTITDQVSTADGNTVCAAGSTTNCQAAGEPFTAGPTQAVAPAFAGAYLGPGGDQLTLVYNEIVTGAAPADYTANNGSSIPVTGATVGPNGETVVLSTTAAGGFSGTTNVTTTSAGSVCDPTASGNCQASAQTVTAPALSSAACSTSGQDCTVQYSAPVTCPAAAAGDFALGTDVGSGCAPGASTDTLVVAFANPLPSGTSATLTYTEPASPTSSNAVFFTGAPPVFAPSQTVTATIGS